MNLTTIIIRSNKSNTQHNNNIDIRATINIV